jgi:hypothetical protein
MAKGGTNVKTVAELLKAKPARVVSVTPEQSVLEAIKVSPPRTSARPS